jgi:hypothetical protein
MFDQYTDGNVKEHSVGMRYVKLLLAINSDRQGDEEFKDNWDKYIDQVANRKAAEDQGYFWPILEAKIIEGSAVVKGSNSVTPTLEVSETKDNNSNENKDNEPPSGTHNGNEPTKVTHKESIINFYKHLK